MSKQTQKCIVCHGKGTMICGQCKGTGREKRSDFHRVHITSWEEIRAYRREFYGESWIFRGMPDSTLPLETLLDRHCKSFLDDLKVAHERERALLREFKRRFHQYTTDFPKGNDILEWFSIMQHYGAPTRLLDFTYSISIAAFFALEKARMEEASVTCSLWAINARWAETLSARMFEGAPEHCFFDGPVTEENALSFEKVFMRKRPKQFACPVNPFRLNERLTIQKGIFMCPGDITRTFEENLKSMDGYNSEKNIINIIINMEKKEWRNALDRLYNRNITRAVLFPGLEGFATSLTVSPPKLLLPGDKSQN